MPCVISDTPIAYTKNGRPLFDNTATVVALLATSAARLITVRRNNQPGRGLIGLPGGYHMRGETWQQAGCRELWEETGYIVDPNFIKIVSFDTDEYGNNLVIARTEEDAKMDPDYKGSDEVQEIVYFSHGREITDARDWAFPRHHNAAFKLWSGGL